MTEADQLDSSEEKAAPEPLAVAADIAVIVCAEPAPGAAEESTPATMPGRPRQPLAVRGRATR
jgi:hypothetical protein